MKCLTLTLILISTSATVLAENIIGIHELNKAIPGRYDEGHRTSEQQAAIIKLVNTYKKIDEYSMGMLGYVQYTDDKWYSLNRDLSIQGVNIVTEQYLGVWPLTPWAYLLQPKELMDTYAEAGLNFTGFYLNNNNTAIGCLNKTPLRYGKISNEPEQESLLVLFLNKQLIFFSPQYQRTVFATYYDASDALTKVESDELRADYGSRFMEKDAQFISGIFYAAHNIGMPAHRIYSKIYIDDFNKDGNTDILVWSKYYKSNKSTEPAGFTFLRDEFAHYSRDLTAQQKSEAGVTGEYQPQETSPETIQNWLNAKNLTWQKGFPSKSECAGEEGKLIPEMHDPLLNDPDVLK